MAERSVWAVDAAYPVGAIDPRLYGSFVEHMGRCVYSGLFEPSHPSADENGFRTDVLDLVRALGVTTVRYPGGNFVSGYRWEDGVGPVADRPRRVDLAWGSTETNRFGLNEFIDWSRLASVEPMMAVNLGTRGIDDARRLVEYCNHPGGTELSDLRRAHGHAAAHDIRFWCVGNEMDGPWQIGALDARAYGRLARETTKAMRWAHGGLRGVDGRHWSDGSSPGGLTLAACGSSLREMETYARWEYDVLDECFEVIDIISLHTYFRNPTGDAGDFLANIDGLDAYLGEVAAIADAVAATRRSSKRIMLSLDEWNVWYKAGDVRDHLPEGFPEAPRLIEEVYDVKDALLVGGALITLLNHADRVKSACLAQLVNVIAPILTEPGGAAWTQTIFHPFALAARHGRGETLRAAHVGGAALDLAVTRDGGAMAAFVLNRDLAAPCELDLSPRGFDAALAVEDATVLHHDDLEGTNGADHRSLEPATLDGVRVLDGTLRATLPPASWSVIRLQVR